MKLFDVGVEPVGVIAIGVLPRGVLAIGPLATGVVAIGQVSRGFVAIGQLAVGVIAVGQVSVGMWWSSGQLAIAPLAGPAMLRVAPFGVLYPLRLARGEPDWRIQTPLPRGWRLVASLLLVVAVGALVWFFGVLPAQEALFGQGGVFGVVTGPG